MSDDKHTRLVLPGPVEVRRDVLDAQAQWMIGHRTEAFADLYRRITSGVQQAFVTEKRIYISTSSGSGLWEAAVRNGIRDGHKVLHAVNGAFSDRWAQTSVANGKNVVRVEADWGQAVKPEQIADALANDTFDAVCIAHNETSTAVINPIAAIGEVVAQHADTLFMVDAVSSFLGAELRVDDWGIDFVLTSSQKAFALPPGLAFAVVSPRVLQRAEQIPHRGYYFDLLTFEKYAKRDNTPATPPVSLMFAADEQLKAIMAEGLENRWARHAEMRSIALEWVEANGFAPYAEEGYRSPTVTAVRNTRGIDVMGLADFMLNERGMAIDKGYGKLKGETWRIPHMGDMTPDILREYLAGVDAFLAGS